MENKKSIIIVIVILVLYLLLMVVILGIDKLKNKLYRFEILMEPNVYLKYENGKWEDIESDTTEMLGKKYHVYGDHQFLYEGIMQYAMNKWYAFDNNDEPLSLPDQFFAYRGNKKMDVRNFEILDMTESEIEEAKELLKEEKVNFEIVFKKTEKIEFDLDNDGKIETIYIVTNDYDYESQKKAFSIVYIKNENKVNILISHIADDYTTVPNITLKEIFDYNHNKKYELLFKQIYFDKIGTCSQIFELEKGKYKSTKDCKIIKGGDE